jgi:hypothetical protein
LLRPHVAVSSASLFFWYTFPPGPKAALSTSGILGDGPGGGGFAGVPRFDLDTLGLSLVGPEFGGGVAVDREDEAIFGNRRARYRRAKFFASGVEPRKS